MNYLAHAYLARASEEWVVGSILADMPLIETVPEQVQEGIAIHQAVDAYLVAHPRMVHITAELRPFVRKYAPPVADIAYDHWLATTLLSSPHFDLLSFSQQVTETLHQYLFLLDTDSSPWLHSTQKDWLATYADYDGIYRSCRRLSDKVSRPEILGPPDTVADLCVSIRDAIDAPCRQMLSELEAEVTRLTASWLDSDSHCNISGPDRERSL